MKKTLFVSTLVALVIIPSLAYAMTLDDVIQLLELSKKETSGHPVVLGASAGEEIPATPVVLPEGVPVKLMQGLRYIKGSPSIVDQKLKAGMENSDQVKILQVFLNAVGYDLPPTGKFASMTHRAVKAFQNDSKLQSDGIVGPITREAIKTKIEANTTK